MRFAGLALATLFVVLFGVLTLVEISNNGLDGLGLLSVLILAMFVIGLLGAFRHPPEA